MIIHNIIIYYTANNVKIQIKSLNNNNNNFNFDMINIVNI